MIIGHEKIWQFLKKSAELKKIPHALLFSGQEKLGKKTLAIEFINWLLKANVQKRPHPDFIFIEPISLKPNRPKKEIKIDQIRELIWRLSLKPSIAPYKVAILDQAHFLNPAAQNCLLKTLEEPRGETILILITEYPEILLPTILSRVQQIKFYPVKKAEIENYLREKGLPEREIGEISQFSLGRPGIAIDLIDQEKLAQERKRIKDLIFLSHSPLAFRFQYVRQLVREENLRETLDSWLRYFHNLLIKKTLQPDFSIYSFQKLKEILSTIFSTNFLLATTNINPRLALEILMLKL